MDSNVAIAKHLLKYQAPFLNLRFAQFYNKSYFYSMQKPYVIGVCGGSGSGKTTLVHLVRQSFDAEKICLLSQDDFYIPREEQAMDENGVVDFDRLTSIDLDKFQLSLSQLMQGESISLKEYVFNNEQAVAQVKQIDPAPVIIIEGLFILHSEDLKKMMDLTVFVDTKDSLKVIRRIQRDQTERNYPLDDVLYRYEHHVLPSYMKYIEPHKKETDLIINNNGDINKAASLLSNLIKGMLI